ncbi:nickel transporter [Streptomyces sp. NPDC007861]|uniref:nickel transporter n=1 Tax=Streptomyces sp. NPDC007861 TaxID=3154893 RepID=UPI0033F26920
MLAAAAAPAAAHPLGNFTVNRYDGLVVSPRALTVDHVEDLAEIPAARIRPRELSRGELAAWAKARCAAASRDARLRVDGRAVALAADIARAEVRPGQAGLPTLRVECRMTAPLPERGAVSIGFTVSAAGSEGPGWHEITARGDRTTITSSDVPQKSVSRRLASYPTGLLDSPPERTSAAFTAVPGGPALTADEGDDGAAAPPPSVLPRGADRWTQALTGLVERRELTLSFAALALAVAVGLGALHALAPGHGKTLMAAAAAAGGRSSLRNVLVLGASVTVTHTLGVFALGALVAAGSAVGPSVVGWLGVVSGVLVTVAGAVLVRQAWHQRAHGHAHGHTHVHLPGGHGHAHHHEHNHDHDHDHGHTHERPSQPLRRTVLLGFAGGLVPSPSAVVVLVGAAALGHAWFGLLLVVAYGAGLALTLTAAGFAVVRLGERAGRWLARRRGDGRRGGRLVAFLHRTAPLSTAVAVLVLGCGLVFRGAAGAIS